MLHVEPKERDWKRSEEEEENGSLKAETEEGELFGTVSLPANGFHSDR